MGQANTTCPPPVGILASHLLGAAGQTTTLSGGNSYSGDYQVLGDLVLPNGTYTLTPGTVFYVDGRAARRNGFRRVSGSTITVGNNATLAGLPAGQYAYQLVVEGQPVAAPQKLFVNP